MTMPLKCRFGLHAAEFEVHFPFYFMRCRRCERKWGSLAYGSWHRIKEASR